VSRQNGRGASLYEFRDLDILAKIWDEEEVTTEQLADSMGLAGRNVNVGSRLSWMRRFGMVRRSTKGLWCVSSGGGRVIEARARAASETELKALPDEAMVETMASVVSRYRFLDTTTAAMLRREFLFGTQRR
jgi:hypothetical protein